MGREECWARFQVGGQARLEYARVADVIFIAKRQPCSQAVSPLPPFVVGRKTLVAAGHVTTCDTNFSVHRGGVNESQLKRKKGDRWSLIKTHKSKYTFEILQSYSKLNTGQMKYTCMCPAY